MASGELKAELAADQAALRRARRRARRELRMRQGAFVIPSLFTFANMLLGFVAIVSAIEGRFLRAAALVFIAGLCDTLDGRLARLLGTTSKFGVELDSLSDLISFCLAPAVLVYLWTLKTLEPQGLWICGFYLRAGAGRLARFNILTVTGSKRYFTGLPTPAAAGVLMAVLAQWPVASGFPLPAWTVAAGVAALALLMVSTLPYRTFKDVNYSRRHPLVWLMGIGALLILLSWRPAPVLLAIGAAYALSAPLAALLRAATGQPSPLANSAPTAE